MLTTGLNLCQGNVGLGRIEASELAASTQHIAATAAAKIDVHMASSKGGLKRFNRRV